MDPAPGFSADIIVSANSQVNISGHRIIIRIITPQNSGYGMGGSDAQLGRAVARILVSKD